MEVDLLKPATEEQMEMMMMMMQMDKLPGFEVPFHGVSESPRIDFSGGSSNMNGTTPQAMFSSKNGVSPWSSSSFTFVNSPAFADPTAQPSCPSQKRNSMAAMREMIFRIAAMQPIHIDPESVKPPKRRNVRISKDPQSVAARHRRERISEKIRILQRLVPGGTKMDTASMLDEAIHYVKFLKTQVQSLEKAASTNTVGYPAHAPAPAVVTNPNYNSLGKGYQACQMFSSSTHMLS